MLNRETENRFYIYRCLPKFLYCSASEICPAAIFTLPASNLPSYLLYHYFPNSILFCREGSGKTNLSYFLGAELMINVINLDDFTESNRGCFIDAMDLSRLEIRIKNLNRIGSMIIE